MPQISPLSWTFIFLALLIFTLVTLTNLNYFNTPILNTNTINNNENSLNW